MIKLTNHYKKRYKERVFEYGTDLDNVENDKIKKELNDRTRSEDPWVKCKIYRGYVWWFSATTILTVYALPVIRTACKY